MTIISWSWQVKRCLVTKILGSTEKTTHKLLMKQRRFGKKVQNWHAPLASHELKNRFRRKLLNDPAAQSDADLFCAPIKGVGSRDEFDAYWNPHDPWQADYHRDEQVLADASDYLYYELKQFFRDLAEPGGIRFSEPNLGTHETAPIKPEPIEQRLASHVKLITSSPLDKAALENQFADPAIAIKLLSEAAKGIKGSSDLLLHIQLFQPFWIRKLDDFASGGDVVSLLKHLFVKDTVPTVYFDEWYNGRGWPDLKWICWFIILGQKANLKRASQLFNWRIQGKFQYYLEKHTSLDLIPAELPDELDTPGGNSPARAAMFAEVLRLGGNELDMIRLCSDYSYLCDPTSYDTSDAFYYFWSEAVKWLSANRALIDDQGCRLVLRWAMHLHTEYEGNRVPTRFEWRGRTARAAVRQATDYHDQLYRPYLRNLHWQKRGWDWTYPDSQIESEVWTFVELTSSRELQQEGMDLHHCVYSYDGRCVAGASAIVSLRLNGKARVTIEVSPASKRIVQARGTCNRESNQKEAMMIRKWLEAIF